MSETRGVYTVAQRLGLRPLAEPLEDSFAALTAYYRRRAGLSGAELAQAAHINASHLTRMERRARPTPGRDIVEQLAGALRLPWIERNRYLAAAGYLPPVLERFARLDPAVQAVADALSDVRLTAEEREQLRSAVLAVCAAAELPRAKRRRASE